MKFEVGVAYHCATEELANKFLKLAEEQGYEWLSGAKLTNYNHWDEYKEQTCYKISAIEYSCIGCYKNDCEIIEFTDELCDDAEDAREYAMKMNKLLFVEDGSVDADSIEELAEMGIKVIVYRQGANKPELVDLGE